MTREAMRHQTQCRICKRWGSSLDEFTSTYTGRCADCEKAATVNEEMNITDRKVNRYEKALRTIAELDFEKNKDGSNDLYSHRQFFQAVKVAQDALRVDDDEHTLDSPLGVLHEAAIRLSLMGLSEISLQIAEAHEQIQQWLIEAREGEQSDENPIPMEIPDAR
jgi:hypothetical protein